MQNTLQSVKKQSSDFLFVAIAFLIYVLVALFVGGSALAKASFVNILWGSVWGLVISIALLALGKTNVGKKIPFLRK